MEKWEFIDNFERYEVSNTGRVRNRKTKRLLKQTIVEGYYKVTLYKDCKAKTFRVHRLVAMNFVRNFNNDNEVYHINNNTTDNRASNLAWISRKDNLNRGLRNERISQYRTGLKRPDLVEKMSIKIVGINISNDFKIFFNSIKEACDQGFERKEITRCLRNKQESYNGFIWEKQ